MAPVNLPPGTTTTTIGFTSAEMNGASGSAKFEPYLTQEEVQIAINNGQIITGSLRINPRNYEDAFVSAPGGLADIYICGMQNRNRALAGDLVCVMIEPSYRWRIVGQKNLDSSKVAELRSFLEPSPQKNKTKKTEILSNISVYSQKSQESSQYNASQVRNAPNKTEANLPRDVVINGIHMATLPIDQRAQSSQVEVIETLVTGIEATQDQKKKKRKRHRKKKKSEAESNLDADDEEEDGEKVEQDPSIKVPSTESQSFFEEPSQPIIQDSNEKTIAIEEELIVSSDIPSIGCIKTWSDLAKYPHIKPLIQITGKVVFIKERNHPRVAGGHLSTLKDKNPSFALFSPLDSRVPRLMIPMHECPKDFYQFPERYRDHLFMARIDKWDEGRSFPLGHLECHIGRSGEIEAESRLILMEKSIDSSEFPPEAYEGLPLDPKDKDGEKWVLPDSERQYRRDFTQQCVFTIDPSTARDLDDALSIRPLDDETFEVGVHIADVSYFLREGLPLDKIARRRTTSCYLVQKVIPMLPRILCERLCSLNAGEEKLTFSVVWKMNRNAEILDTWFGRSIMISCCKLSYEMAQDIIDNPEREWKADELPQIYGKWQPKDIAKSVHLLQSMAVQIRRRRFDNGALLIDKMKIGFVLDSNTGLPIGFSPYKLRPANHLVEEFMLLANISVATRIHSHYPKLAFLRRHPEPDSKQLSEFASFCKANNLGDSIDTTTSGSLHDTISALRATDPLIAAAVSHYLLKSMAQAVYFCAGACNESYRHYALSVDLYTHFTSPIRRYPDVIVHRMLAATLNQSVPGEGQNGRPVSDGAQELDTLATRCNEMKKNAREASEASSNLFLKLYYRAVGPIEEEAVVTKILDNSLEILLLNSAFCNRVSLADVKSLIERIELARLQENDQSAASMKIHWKNFEKANNSGSEESETITQTIAPCDRIKVLVKVDKDNLHRLITTLVHPSFVGVNPLNYETKNEDWGVNDVWKFESSTKSVTEKTKKSTKTKTKKVNKLIARLSALNIMNDAPIDAGSSLFSNLPTQSKEVKLRKKKNNGSRKNKTEEDVAQENSPLTNLV